MKEVLAGIAIDTESTKKLKSFIQASNSDSDENDLTLRQPQAKQVAYESKSGGIIEAVKEMQAKAEGELSDLRKKEMADAHEFKMLEQSLSGEISHGKEKLSSATKAKAGAEETLSTSEGDLVATKKTKAADEEYSANLKTECETAASEWAARQESAKAEMAAIDKASEILASGVTALVQVQTNKKSLDDDSEDEDDAQSEVRQKLVRTIQRLGKKFHSFGLMQLATVASSDPFVKIRGLIEDMIEKLLKEAEEEATQKAFCDKEMGASKKSQAEKTATIDKLQTRIDGNSATIAELNDAIKTLEAEVADIDKAQSEATKIRTEEKTDNLAAIKDFRDSANAVVAAMGVLKSFYEGGALLQTSRSTRPEFGGAKTDAASGIISVLEVAESDFTRLLAETETEEDAAADAYAKQTEENKVSKATKEADAKAKASEVKSLTVELGHAEEDHASTSTELDAVNAYIDKLRPQCEEKAMSYEEKKARREQEIAGLKEALEILSGQGMALAQTGRYLRRHVVQH